MIEKAIIVREVDKLANVDYSAFQRIYFGNENCPEKFPNQREIELFIQFCADNKLEGTILTPLVPEIFFNKITSALLNVPDNIEIVINDLGLYNNIKEKKNNFVLGRLLMPIKKDIRISSNTENTRKSIYNPAFFNFYNELGFKRFELDNVNYNFFNEQEPCKHLFSVYYPQVITNVFGENCVKCNALLKEKCNILEETKSIKGTEQNSSTCIDIAAQHNIVFYNSEEINPNLSRNCERLVFTNC